MNQTELATCHCIISHPTKPKFLAVRHADGWSPPIVQFPAKGSVGYKAANISEGISKKYGLKTTLLRHLVETANYHCVELEVQSGGSRKLEAIWMDREAYSRARRTVPGESDPFDDWLLEKERGQIPVKRPPWEREGWFREAGNWIHFQLDKLGLQSTGSVEQFRAATSGSCILRIPTSTGRIYFKASYAKPPGEAMMTGVLADKWPEYVVQPLALERTNNWMLVKDFESSDMRPLTAGEYPDIARVMARIQVESIALGDEWKRLACPVHNISFLSGLLGDIPSRVPVLTQTESGLDADELKQLRQAGKHLQALCDQLDTYSIPDTLVHQDFRADNFYQQNGEFRITDWSDSVISHPFFCLSKMMASTQHQNREQDEKMGDMLIDEAQMAQITDAYLESFTQFETAERLREAMQIVAGLQTAWLFHTWSEEMKYLEENGREYRDAASKVQSIARQMIKESPE